MVQLSLESYGTLLYCLLPSCITCSDCIPQFVFISGATVEAKLHFVFTFDR